MNNLKLFFSALTVSFAILSLTNAMSTDIAMSIMFICFAVTMFINSKESINKKQKKMAICFFVLGVFLLLITAYNVASFIWKI